MPNVCIRLAEPDPNNPQYNEYGERVFKPVNMLSSSHNNFETEKFYKFDYDAPFYRDGFVAEQYLPNGFIHDLDSDKEPVPGYEFETNYDFGTGPFYIAFWAKFGDEIYDPEYPPVFVISFEDGSVYSCNFKNLDFIEEFASRDTWYYSSGAGRIWHWFMISRNKDGELRMYVDNEPMTLDYSEPNETGELYSQTYKEPVDKNFNLTGNSYVYMGTSIQDKGEMLAGNLITLDDLWITKEFYSDWEYVEVPENFVEVELKENKILFKDEEDYMYGYSFGEIILEDEESDTTGE